MDQAHPDLQLKVWKELAISKQILMRAATDALKLNPDCTQEELKEALEGALKKVAKADADLFNAQEQAKVSIAALEKKLTASEKALASAKSTVEELQSAQEKAAREMAAERAGTAKELHTMKSRLAEKEKALKAINLALADTPENVIRKMNGLKKQKQEEADARKQVETSFKTLRAEKQKQDQKLADAHRDSAKLAGQHRDLHGLCVTLHKQLEPLVADAKDLPALPELDSKLLEAVEQANSNPKKK